MRHAFQVAYDGARYFGFVRQPGHPTVEAELLEIFSKCGLYHDLRDVTYRVAARTDRGVSGMGQVVALDVLWEPNLQELNSVLPEDIAVLVAVEVKPDFNPRTQAQSKHYCYVCEAPHSFNLPTAREAAKLFEGTHNFSHFCKREPGKPTTGDLEHVRVRGKKILVFDFIARGFLWQQVRRMVEGLLAVGKGALSVEELKSMLDGREKHSMRPSPADGLFLVDTKYLSFRFRPDARARKRFVGYLKSLKHPRYGVMAAPLCRKGFV